MSCLHKTNCEFSLSTARSCVNSELPTNNKISREKRKQCLKTYVHILRWNL
jgi:hypothetical protein